MPEYRLRVDDVLDFVFRVTRNEIPDAYEINVGDEFTIESATDKDLKRTLIVLPDGTITLPLLGQVRAAHLSVPQLRDELEKLYHEVLQGAGDHRHARSRSTRKLEDLRYTVGGRSGFGGQVRSGKVTPEGTIQLPAVGTVPAQGLTLDEFAQELRERFAKRSKASKSCRCSRSGRRAIVYVLGEVKIAGPLHAGSTHHGDASHGHGRQLEHRCPHQRRSWSFAVPTTGG